MAGPSSLEGSASGRIQEMAENAAQSVTNDRKYVRNSPTDITIKCSLAVVEQVFPCSLWKMPWFSRFVLKEVQPMGRTWAWKSVKSKEQQRTVMD